MPRVYAWTQIIMIKKRFNGNISDWITSIEIFFTYFGCYLTILNMSMTESSGRQIFNVVSNSHQSH